MIIAACMVPFVAGAASAQFPAAPRQQRPQQVSPCVAEFGKLRDAAEKRAAAIRAASARKASPKEACGLFTAFTTAEAKMLKYAVDNAVWCGIPAQIIDTIKKGHAHSDEMRTKVCRIAAAAPVAPRGPTLSDALSAPITDSSNIRTGRGTFDTLTGTPLGK